MTTRSKFYIASIFIVTIMALLLIVTRYQFSRLADLQNRKFYHSAELMAFQDASHISDTLYKAAASAMLRREPQKALPEWEMAKHQGLTLLAELEKTADKPDKRELYIQARSAFDHLVISYEEKELPLINSGANTGSDITVFDDDIAGQIEVIRSSVSKLGDRIKSEVKADYIAYEAVQKRYNQLNLLLWSAAILMAILLTWRLSTSIEDPLQNRVAFIASH